MWDNPRLLNAAANLLAASAALALLYAALQLLLRSPLFPLREVTLHGALAHTARADVEHAVAGRMGGNFFAADLAAMRAGLEQLPWVRRAQLRRVWPDRIEVTLEEHVALAQWGDADLVNTHGEQFRARSAQRLPVFAGPAGSASEVASRFRRFSALLAPLGETPERVILTPRYAWQLRLASGLNLELGRDGAETVEQRLARFVAAWPDSLGRLQRRPMHVDLRYPNGFALRVPEWSG
ncbi:MAG: cell division protein FtsQ/DivIB [Burkholderiales bacterium]